MDFASGTLFAKFNPGDSQANVSISIIKDQIFEPTEVFMLNLTVSDNFSNINGRLCVKPGHKSVAEGEIIDSNGVYSIVHT